MRHSKILTTLMMVTSGLVAIYWIDIWQYWRQSLTVAIQEQEVETVEEDKTMVAISDIARENYRIQTRIFSTKKLVVLPKDAVITAGDQYFVYVYDGIHFREVKIQPTTIAEQTIAFPYHNTTGEEQFVVTGAEYLRIIFLNNSGSPSGHSH